MGCYRHTFRFTPTPPPPPAAPQPPAVPAREVVPAAAPGSLAYRQTRRLELEARAARGQALTGAQQEWLRRERVRQAEGAVQALAA